MEQLFGLSALGYCRNMVVKHGRLCVRALAPSVDIKGSFFSSKHTMVSGAYTLMKT